MVQYDNLYILIKNEAKMIKIYNHVYFIFNLNP